MEIHNIQQVYLFLALTSVLLESFVDSIQNNCSFPMEYQGAWYQQNIGTFNISRSALGSKGTCYRKLHNRDTYIVYNRKEDCYRCMAIMRTHHNVLQYKESYCMGSTSLGNICSMIRGNYVLYTLMREPATPIPCTFQGSYVFSYTNGSGLMCNDPVSTLSACASDAHLKFHFKHCNGVSDSFDKEYDFKCLAQWNSGGKYMIGRFESPNMWQKMYRCFLYEDERPGQATRVAMSMDASCFGLVNIDDAPALLVLTRSESRSRPATSCTFPDWLKNHHAKWHDLSSRTIYHVDSASESIRIYHKPHHHAPKQITDTLRCYQLDEPNTTGRLYQAIAQTTSNDCVTTYECVRIFRRSDEVVEFYRGRKSKSLREICDETNFLFGNKQLLIPTKLTGSPCPFDGRYEVEISKANSMTCKSTFSSGCSDSNHLTVELAACPTTSPASSLTCLSNWSHNKTTYVIAKKSGSSRVANCFSFVQKADSIDFSLDQACNMGTTPIVDKHVQYSLRGKAGSCDGDETKNGKSTGSAITGANAAWSIHQSKNQAHTILVCFVLLFSLLNFTNRPKYRSAL